MITTSTINILGEIGASVSWESTGSLGTINVGEISEFYVKAVIDSPSTFNLEYIIYDGQLPPGLNLLRDGTISGSIPTNINVSATSTNYNFSIAGIDTQNNRFLEGTFYITSAQSTNTDYTSLFCKPLMSTMARRNYQEFTTNRDIFVDDLIYRPLDSNFGVQRSPKLIISYGVEKLSISEYASVISRNFNRRSLYISGLKTAISKNSKGVITHELIYLDIIDPNINAQGVSIPEIINFNNRVYYPSSITTMRSRLNTTIKTTNSINPSFTKTIQKNDSISMGYIPFIPLCYVIPGKSSTVIRKIKDSNFKFNLIDFEIDRIYIVTPLNEASDKYLLLNRSPIVT